MMNANRLYMDNAATSFPKPPEVIAAMTHYATEIGASAGRGGYAEALQSAAIIAECRRRLQRLFNGEKPEHFIFTLNCTDGLNIALKGLVLHQLRTGRPVHAVCTEIDHNSVLRPLHAMQDMGWLSVSHVPVDPATGRVDPADIGRALRPETRLIAITYASNVTGTLQDVAAISRITREREIPLLVDAAQAVGHIVIDVQKLGIDLMAAPGHKGLLGAQGTGMLYIRPGVEKIMATLKEGGTGSISEHDRQPDFMPDRFECGSHNAMGLAGLSAGVNWILERGAEKVAAHDGALVRAFIAAMGESDEVRFFGPQTHENRVGVFSMRIEGLSPHELAAIMESEYGVLTRPGIHCAPRIHATIGTTPFGGSTRLSFGPFLTEENVRYAARSLIEIGQKMRSSAGVAV
jgi:cysteine desulfurase family protein